MLHAHLFRRLELLRVGVELVAGETLEHGLVRRRAFSAVEHRFGQHAVARRAQGGSDLGVVLQPVGLGPPGQFAPGEQVLRHPRHFGRAAEHVRLRLRGQPGDFGKQVVLGHDRPAGDRSDDAIGGPGKRRRAEEKDRKQEQGNLVEHGTHHLESPALGTERPEQTKKGRGCPRP